MWSRNTWVGVRVAEVDPGPGAVVLVREVAALEEVGHPTDAALGEREPQVGERSAARGTR